MASQYAEFITAALQGDKNGYINLYKATFRQNYFIANEILGNEQYAFEIIKDVYVQAFNALDSITNCDYFPSWTRHLTLMKCRDFVVKNMGENCFVNEAVLPLDYDYCNEFLPYESIGSPEIQGRILESINSLNTADRMTAILAFYCRMSCEEGAEFLGIMPDSFAVTVSRIKGIVKQDVDTFLGNVSPAAESEESPHIYPILRKAMKNAPVNPDMFRASFKEIAAASFLIPKPAYTEPTYAAPSETPISAPVPVAETAPIKETASKKEKKAPLDAKTKKIIIGAVAGVLVIALIISMIFIFKGKKGEEGLAPEGNITETTEAQMFADEALIEALRPYELEYADSLYGFFKRPNSEYKNHKFNFGDIDGNGIQDILLIDYDGKNYSLTAITTPNYNFNENYFDYNGNDEYGELLIGEKSGVIIIEKDFSIEGTVPNEGFCIYTKFERGQNNEETLTYINYYNYETNSFNGRYEYEIKSTGEKTVFNNVDEFNSFLANFTKGYRKLTSGYSIEDFVNSGKSLIEYIKSTPKPNEEYATQPTIEESTSSVQAVSYEWNPSKTLNKYKNIKYFNEKSVIFTMEENGLSGLLDNKGNVVISPEYKSFIACSYGGYGSRDGNHYAAIKEGSYEYFIDMETFEVTEDPHGGHGGSEEDPPAGFSNLEAYSNGVAAAEKNGKWGYVDKSHTTVIPFEYDAAETEAYFANEKCRAFDGNFVAVRKGSVMGIIDMNNNTVVPFEYSVIMQGENGIYIAQKDGIWGFITLDGAEFKEPEYSEVPEITTESVYKYDWEDAYLTIIQDEANINKAFLLSDLDEDGTADLVIFDRSAQTDFIYVYLNGNTSEDDSLILGGTELYKSRSDATLGTIGNYHSGTTVSESYSKYSIMNNDVHIRGGMTATYVYADHSFEEIISEEYRYMDTKGVDSETTKEKYEQYAYEFEDGFYMLESTFIGDFLDSGDNLSDYYYE